MPNPKDQLGNLILVGDRVIIGARVHNIQADDSILVKPTHESAQPFYVNPAHGVQVIADLANRRSKLPCLERPAPQNRPITIDEAFTLDCIIATIVNAPTNCESASQTLDRIRGAIYALDDLEAYGSPCPPVIPAHDFESVEAEKRRMALGE